MIALFYFAFSGSMTICEFIGAVGMLLGTYFLTHKKSSLGWFVYAIAHGFAAYIGYQKEQIFFADFQIASLIVAIIGTFQSEN